MTLNFRSNNCNFTKYENFLEKGRILEIYRISTFEVTSNNIRNYFYRNVFELL